MAGAGSAQGIVVESTGSWLQVQTEQGIIASRLAGRQRLEETEASHPVAVGDHVRIGIQQDGTGVVQEIQERRNAILRQSTHQRNHAQVLIANLDMAWVVQSVRQPRFNTGFIDRFLVTCEAYGVPAGIIMNKSDLMKSRDADTIEEIRSLYESLGYAFVICSAASGEGLDRLEASLKNRVSALIGPSGTGKSSLLNAIDPSFERRTSEISSYSGRGRHTTTHARLLPLSFGGMIADTPGIRELGLVNIQPRELSLYFPDMEPFRGLCRYPDCTHEHEPGCAVMQAFEEGSIDADRYHSYLMMLESLKGPNKGR